MLTAIKQTLKKALKQNGWIVGRYRPHLDKFRLLKRLCDDHRCHVLIDVGANQGQFASEMIEVGFAHEIVSVEPQEGAHRILADNARGHPRWAVAPRMCMGERNGVATIHISANSVSSSVLDVLAASIVAEPGTRFLADEQVPMRRLDDWFTEFRPGASRLALKLDVQGFERQVLEGATGIIERVPVLIVEMSLTPLYQGAATFSELLDLLGVSGYRLAGIFPGFTDRESMRMLQVDGVFERLPT